jgi:hypothetical protein
MVKKIIINSSLKTIEFEYTINFNSNNFIEKFKLLPKEKKELNKEIEGNLKINKICKIKLDKKILKYVNNINIDKYKIINIKKVYN